MGNTGRGRSLTIVLKQLPAGAQEQPEAVETGSAKLSILLHDLMISGLCHHYLLCLVRQMGQHGKCC